MSWLGIALWGGAVGLDATSFPQVMISRPFVAGTVAGLVLGRPIEGAVLGAVLEVLALTGLPIGAARTPEPGIAAVASTAAVALAAPAGAGQWHLLIALAFGLVWERVGGASVHVLRRVNERIALDPTRRTSAGPVAVELRHLAAMALDAARGAIVTLAGAWLGARVLTVLGPAAPVGPTVTAAFIGIAAAAVLGAALTVFGGLRRHRVAFGAGLAGGGLALLLT